MKKIEIIERITDANGSISENILTSWEHKNQFIPEIIRFGELKIYLQERIVKKNEYYGSNVPLFRRNGYRQSGTMIP